MENLVKINKRLGWILLVGIPVSQLVITIIAFDMGYMAPFIALLVGVLFLPFLIVAFSSTLNRERHLKKIKTGLLTGLFFLVVLPLFLPIFFDQEFIYLSLVGFFLGTIMWYFRKKIELQLVILNGIGTALWLLISLSGLLSK